MSQSDTKVVDLDARLRALEPESSFIVQAPAGSGKTGLLTQRYLKLLASAQCPEEIIAITFTKKAASEMRSRILSALKHAETSGPPDNDYDRLTWTLAKSALQQNSKLGWNIITSPSRMKLMTIDSLSAWLANRLPVVSQFGALSQVSEAPEALYRQAIHQTLQHLESGMGWGDAIERLIAHVDNNLLTLERLLMVMLAKREQWLRHVQRGASSPQIRQELEAALEKVVGEHLQTLLDLIRTSGFENQLDVLRFAGTHAESGSNISSCKECYALPETGSDTLTQWLGIADIFLTSAGQWRKKITKAQGFPSPSSAKNPELKACYQEMKRRFGELVDGMRENEELRQALAGVRGLPAVTYTENQWLLLEALFELLPLAVAELHLVFRAHATVDFSEVAISAIDALGREDQPTDLALILDYRIQHIMVDEFQDTSFGQFQLLQRLTAGWVNGDGRTLFLVGDPMQSIYRFREAEVGFFLWARMHGVGGLKLQSLNLQVNFRSQAGIVSWVNQVFQDIFPKRDDMVLGAVSYSPSVSFKAEDGGAAVEIHPFYENNPGLEASELVGIIKAIKQKSHEQSIAVLVQARSHLAPIIGELKRNGLTFQAIDVDELSERVVIQDLSSLTRALLHYGDNIAWLAILRGPWCGLTLQELENLNYDPSRTTVWQCLDDTEFLTGLSADSQGRATRFIRVMRKALSMRGRCSLRLLVESTWLRLGGTACVASESELDDVDTFFRLIEDVEQGGESPQWELIEEKINRLYAKPDLSADVNLQLMTIHKSKGLEFDHVLLPGLGRRIPTDNKRLLMWMERPSEKYAGDLLLAPLEESGTDSGRTYEYLRRIDQVRLESESARLLYVAATRAKKKLYLFGHVTTVINDSNVELKPPQRASMLSKLWGKLEAVYREALPAEITPTDEELISENKKHSRTLWRLPSSWALPHIADRIKLSASEQNVFYPDESIKFSWLMPTARHVGTLVHLMLMRIAEQGLERWSQEKLRRLDGYFKQRLLQMGVANSDLVAAVDKVCKALCNVLEDERGRWILQDGHLEAHSEYAVTGVIHDKVVRAVIDRTFVDDTGTLWIIDYKTAECGEKSVEDFLDDEQARYSAQLERYAKLLLAKEPRPVRLGLYYPLTLGWREWSLP